MTKAKNGKAGKLKSTNGLKTVNGNELTFNDAPSQVWIRVRDAEKLIYPANPRLHDIGGVITSVDKAGFQELPKYDSALAGIKAGNGRIEALAAMERDGKYKLPRGLAKHKKDGSWCMPLLIGVDAKTKKQALAYLIDSNNLTMSGGSFDHLEISKLWDMDGYLSLLQDADKDFLVSMEQEDIEALIHASNGHEEIKDTEPQIDKAKELNKKWLVKSGDLWKIGEHLLLCGDSREQDTIKRVMVNDKAALVFTDPPYGVAIGAKNRMLRQFKKSRGTLVDIKDDTLKPDELKKVLLPAFVNIKTIVMAEDCTVFVTAPQGGELGMMMMMMMKDAGLPIRHVLIWKKNHSTFSMGRLDYDYQHEPILLTWGKRHKRPMLGNHKTSIWEIDKPRSSESHPTMKPVELVVNALLNNSEHGDIVFDAYCGSGTTMVASENEQRKSRCIEISPEYCAVILERMKSTFPDLTIKRI